MPTMPLASDRRDLDHIAVLEHGQDGAEPVAGKEHVANHLARFVEHVFQLERDDRECRLDPRVVRGWKRREKQIAIGQTTRGHHGEPLVRRSTEY